MSAAAEGWDPCVHPVHRLIQLHDYTGAVVACRRWSRPPPAPEMADSATLPGEGEGRACALADEAVAMFVRRGRASAEGTIRGVVRQCVAVHYPPGGPAWVGPRGPTADEKGLAASFDRHRNTLLSHLAGIGEAIPWDVRQRGAAITTLLTADPAPAVAGQWLRQVLSAILADGLHGVGVRSPAAGVALAVDTRVDPADPAWASTALRFSRGPGRRPARSEAPVPAIGQPADFHMGEARRNLLLALSKAGQPVKGKQLAALAGYASAYARQHLAPLRRAGYLTWTDDGYELTGIGRDFVSANIVDKITVTSH